MRPDKSLTIAIRATTFDTAAKTRLCTLNIPYVDADTPEEVRGFTSVGVPIGCKAYITAVR